jgi:hypothetical protein
MPPRLRFGPISSHPPAGDRSVIVDTACLDGRNLHMALAPASNLPATTPDAPTAQAVTDEGSPPAVDIAEPHANGSWQFAVTVDDGTTGAPTALAVVPVEVSEAIPVVTLTGSLPLELDLDGNLPADLPLDLVANASSGTLEVTVVRHPGAIGADLAASQLSDAISLSTVEEGLQLHLDRAVLRNRLATIDPMPPWLVVALDIHVDEAAHRVVPWIVHLVHATDG